MKILMVWLDNPIPSFFLHFIPKKHRKFPSGPGKKQSSLLFSPKNKSHTNISLSKIKKVQDLLNHRPRKSLDWLIPHEVFIEDLYPEKDSQVQDLI